MREDITRLLACDRDHVWHPYATMPGDSVRHVVEAASGIRLRLTDGDQTHDVIDGMSSWWAAVHGYRVPELDSAIRGQLDQMAHVMFGGLTHQAGVELAERLVRLTPDPLQHVFLCDSGSVAVEVAMKMALQAQLAVGHRRTTFFTVRGGYHGDTFSPMSVTDPVGGMHSLFTGVLPEHVFAPRPPGGIDLATDDPGLVSWEHETRRLFEQHAHDLAAVIIEPLLQGAGGMHAYSPVCLEILADLAHEHDVLMIHDEIATGWWRTGTRWAAERCSITPDILCTGKALTGGYLTMGAVLCTPGVAAAVSSGEGGALMHGPTFMANPLASRVASASLDLLVDRDASAEVARIERGLSHGLTELCELPGVRDVRVLGAVGVVQLDRPVDLRRVTDSAIANGVWLRPFRDLIYTMPPYVTSDEDLATLTAGVRAAVHTAVQEQR